MINYGQTHDIVTDGPMEVMNLFLDFERLALPELPFELRSVLPSVISLQRNLQHRLNRVVHLPFADDVSIRPLLMTLRDELRRQRVGFDEVWRALLQTLLIYCLRTAQETGIAPVAAGWAEAMERVRQYITSHFAAPLTLEQLADVAFFYLKFRERIGTSPGRYRLQRGS